MRYIQLLITITIFIMLFSIINNQNKQLDNQREGKIQLNNVLDRIEQLEMKTAKNGTNDSLKIKLIAILKDLETVP